jgi:hypothetical protein
MCRVEVVGWVLEDLGQELATAAVHRGDLRCGLLVAFRPIDSSRQKCRVGQIQTRSQQAQVSGEVLPQITGGFEGRLFGIAPDRLENDVIRVGPLPVDR